MRTSRTLKRGFTLVEILIVVVILGILAAIVVPQFTNAADEARTGNVQTQLSTLRNQLELYRARNNGSYPDLANNGWQDLIDGDYIKAAPQNPFFSGDDKTGIGDGEAWQWDADTETLTADGYDDSVEAEEEEEEE